MQDASAPPSRGWLRVGDFLDSFIPADMRADTEGHRRARMFMLSHVFGPILGNSIPVYMYVMNISRDYRAIVFFLSILAFWAYPFALKFTGRYKTLAFVSVQNLIFCALWACYSYGGMTSPFVPWILIFPLLAFLYLPPRGVIRNVLLIQIFGSVAGFIALCFSGFALPSINLDNLQTIGMISMASVAIYFAMMSLYFARMFREQGQFALELNSLVSTSESLREVTEAAQQASRAKAAFVASMSHELRTPLNAIIGYSQLLLEEAEEENDEETRSDVAKVNDAGNHLLSLIDDILTYSRIDAGRMPINPSVRSLSDEVRGWRLECTNLSATLRIRFDERLDSSVSPIKADWTLIAAIIKHIVGSVCGRNHIGELTISLKAIDDGSTALIFRLVDCDGKPVPVDLQDALFSDASDVSSTKYGGVGIEMPLALKLAELMGGTITNDESANGSVVFYLPNFASDQKLAA